MKWNSLNLEATTIMKGIAILMIAMHNFMHLFPFPKENEFDFSFDRTASMVELLLTEPENSIRVLLSYFGHYGVAIFIFLSAYGLTKKYTKQPLYYRKFIINRIIKVYPAFIIAILMWATLQGIYSYGIFGPFKVLGMHFESLILKLSLISNFIPNGALEPIGPWWFIPFIFQFYFSFPLLLKFYDKWQTTGLITLAAFCLTITGTLGGILFDVNLYYTILPYMPIFALGIYLAKKDESGESINISRPIVLLILFIFILGNINQHIWLLSNISFIILFLITMNVVIPKIKNNIRKALLFTGQISMGLFLVNGFLRFPIIHWAVDKDNWLYTILLCLVSLGASYVCAVILHFIEKHVSAKIHSYKTKQSSIA